MKKYIGFLMLALSVSSCKDFLEEQPVTTLTQDYYKTAEGLESLVKGSYQILRFKPDYNQGHYLFGAGSDVEVFKWSDANRAAMGSYANDAWGQGATGTRMTPHVNSLVGDVSGNFSEGAYPEINRCNVFFETYATMDPATQKTLAVRRAEAQFLRSYAYFLVTNVLGDAPLILQSFSGMPANFAFPKAPMKDIYNLIISDLRDAVEILPSTTAELGRITKPAAAHFLAKLYLVRAQGAQFASSSEPTLKALYKGSVPTDLDSAIYYSTMTINIMAPNNAAYGGLSTDFGALWTNKINDYSRDLQKEIILSAQYEPTQTYNGRYGNNLVHLFNSNHTSLRAATPRTMDYGRPYSTAGPSDWAFDMYTDRANDSRYYKTYLTEYFATDAKLSGAKTWDVPTAAYYNKHLKSVGETDAKVNEGKIKYKQRSIAYIENTKDQPFDSLWVASQPYILNVRWQVGSPNNAGYVNADGSLKPGVDIDPKNPIVTNTAGRKIMYRVNGDKGEAFGLDRGFAVASWYMCPQKWIDSNRGKGTDPNGSGAIDVVLMRLAETYLIRAEAYGRKGSFSQAIDDINILRKRAAYHAGEKRPQMLVELEPAVISGKLSIPAEEKVAPFTVKADSYEKIKVDGTEWQAGSPKAIKENYPPTATDLFVQFIYNERARELIFELVNVEDLHNAGILYERVYYRDMMGAPAASTGTVNFPFPTDDISTINGATGKGKGQFERKHTFKAWSQKYLDNLTDENNKPLGNEDKAKYQNYGY